MSILEADGEHLLSALRIVLAEKGLISELKSPNAVQRRKQRRRAREPGWWRAPGPTRSTAH
jgi:hypothetical protein